MDDRRPDGVTCRGAYAFGSACGRCARCDTDPANPKNLKAGRYKLPPSPKPAPEKVTSIMYRIPEEIVRPFNEALDRSGLSGQALVDSMVRHCLSDLVVPEKS